MSETVREVCAEMRDGENGEYFPFTDWEIKVTKKVRHLLMVFADSILAAHDRELSAKDETNRIIVQSAQARFDEELAEKDAEIAKLRTALKPVIDCDNRIGISFHCGDEYLALKAVRDCGQIMKRGVK